jgi:CHAT domain-containing protein/pimeloyl-ACP methyl ester carboxylesterase
MPAGTSKAASSETDWDKLEKALLSTGTRGKPGTQAGGALEGFDEDELQVLRRLAMRSQVERSRAAPRGNVVFLHGITGADLAVVEKGDRDHIWINFPRLIFGRINDLKLRADGGGEANPKLTVIATRINKRYYARAMVALRARWNAEPFAYDWRKDIDTASDELAAMIRARFPGQPVHLVAHSMGGLVSRNMIRRHPTLWEEMRGAELTAGGRLIMLGTPNYGSFAIVQAMTGEDRMMSLLEKLDIKHDMSELLSITNTFLGSYQLLPAPSKLPPTLNDLYLADTWSEHAHVSQAHLNRAHRFFADLESGATIDASRMIYVAGCRQPTIDSMTIDGRGDFEYALTRDGDGRVPHSLGLLPGVPTYYVDEVHGDLARNESVLTALDELLETGVTHGLETMPLHALERAAPSMLEYRSATDRVLMEDLARIADAAQQRGEDADWSREELDLCEDALIRAALGSGRSSRPAKPSVPVQQPVDGRRMELRVRTRMADICDVEAPVICVGHYRGLKPVNGLGAVDARLDGWISLAVRQGMIGGTLGETFYVPGGGRIGAGGAVIAGMGEFGTFNEAGLRILMTNVAMGAGALGIETLATLLVGAGEGNLGLDKVLRGLLNGIGIGLSNLLDETGKEPSLQEVTIVERDASRFIDLTDQLEQLSGDDALPNVRLHLTKPTSSELSRARKMAAARQEGTRSVPRLTRAAQPEFREVRITVEAPSEGKDKYRFSAIAPNSVVPVREVEVNADVVRRTADALRKSDSPSDQRKYGRLLYDYLLPEDFHDLLDGELPVRLIVDRATAAVPWEMACFEARAGGDLRWLGLDLRLSRQFRSMLTQPPGTTPPLNDHLKVLVIADPAKERDLQLPFARMEGRRVVDVLRRMNRPGLRINVESRIGPNECDMVEILAQVLVGGFDVVHYAGHGDFDPANPMKSGWIFGKDQVLTARDIFRARRVPRLVFANACFSGVIRDATAQAPDELSKGLASIAQAFFERGVPNFIGSGWPIGDQQAAGFAETFYENALGNKPRLLDALTAARRRIFDEGIGATWGAYQQYGNPGDQLFKSK